jgi:hypothetical protein
MVWRVVALVVALWLALVSSAWAMEPADRLFQLVNAERVQRGLAPLRPAPELRAAAQRYAQAMAEGGFFGHTAPDGSTFITRNEQAGYLKWRFLAENLAAGQPTPEEALQAWLNSPPHRENLLSPLAEEMGIGYVYRPGSPFGHYWVQELGARAAGPPYYAVQGESAGGRFSAEGRLSPATRSGERAAPLRWVAETGFAVEGPWLAFFRANGDVEAFGLPRSPVVPDPTGSGLLVQFFQRAVLEWHPENPAEARIQRRLLADLLFPGADPPHDPNDPPPGPWHYFPFSPDRPTGLGHFVADYTRTGQPIYFKEFFDRHGGVTAFGYPTEEPKLRDGRWTQKFQAAILEYHPENDRPGVLPGTAIPWRTYRVQVRLLGDEYIARLGLSFR